ncbi:MAG TPA: hypothetical protein VMV31_11485 [Terriglobales bacterium]|nr:hypothetical protein [Terriglobales bacterium]
MGRAFFVGLVAGIIAVCATGQKGPAQKPAAPAGNYNPARGRDRVPGDVWHKAVEVLEQPEWWLVLVAAATGYVVWCQAVQTKNAAEATSLSAGAFVNSERAWVLIEIREVPSFVPIAGGDDVFEVRPELFNHGRTPARITKMVIRQEQVRPPAEPQLRGTPGRLPETPVYPGGISGTWADANRILPPGAAVRLACARITSSELQDAYEGRMSQYVHGFVEYEDTLAGKRILHRTKFCALLWRDEPPEGPRNSYWVVAGRIPRDYIDAT